MTKALRIDITPAQIDAVARAIGDLRIEIAGGSLPDDIAAKAQRRMAELDAITVAYARAQTASRLKAARRRRSVSSTPGQGPTCTTPRRDGGGAF